MGRLKKFSDISQASFLTSFSLGMPGHGMIAFSRSKSVP